MQQKVSFAVGRRGKIEDRGRSRQSPGKSPVPEQPPRTRQYWRMELERQSEYVTGLELRNGRPTHAGIAFGKRFVVEGDPFARAKSGLRKAPENSQDGMRHDDPAGGTSWKRIAMDFLDGTRGDHGGVGQCFEWPNGHRKCPAKRRGAEA